MRTKILIGILVVMMIIPPVSHAGAGFFRYVFDAIFNQLGLDRGPVPKVMNKPPCADPFSGGPSQDTHRGPHRIHIQAEGF